jgi:zinc D-Ala-D-Ala dipeptidase
MKLQNIFNYKEYSLGVIAKVFLNLKYIYLICITLALSCQTKTQKTDYRSELGVISNIADYKKQLNNNPQNRLVDLAVFIPNISLDIRYATTNNFTHQVIYKSARAFARKPVADALKAVQSELNAQGLGLKIFDAYRPYTATLKLYEVYPDKDFVAPPNTGSRHNRGCAIDLTIINLADKKELKMPTGYDSFKKEAAANYKNISNSVLKNRTLFQKIMLKNGFVIYPHEWWHFDYKDWKSFSLLDISFEKLKEI